MFMSTPPSAANAPATPPAAEPAPTVVPETPAAAPLSAEPPKPAEPAAPQPAVVPDKYDLKLAEGVKYDAKLVEGFSSFAKDQKLSNEQANVLLNREAKVYADAQQAVNSQNAEAYKALAGQWKQMSESDPEMGGADFTKNVELAHRAMKAFATPELVQLLESTPYGNHPGLLKMMWKIGKAMGQDTFVQGAGAAPNQPKSREEKYYGAAAGSQT